MMYFFLGFIAGVIVTGVFALVALFFSRQVEKIASEVAEGHLLLPFLPLRNVEIFEPTSSEVEAMEMVIKDNDAKGHDTELKEL